MSLGNTAVVINQLPEKEAASTPLRSLSVTQQSAREEKGPREDEEEARFFSYNFLRHVKLSTDKEDGLPAI